MKILIIKPSSFGDIIHGMQVATLIAKQMPGVVIDWVARDIFSSFVENCSIVRRTYVYERKRGVKGFWNLRNQLVRERYDLVLDMQGLFRSGLMTYWANAPLKIGRADAREFASLFYNKKIDGPVKNVAHAVEVLMQFLPAIGLNKCDLEPLAFKRNSHLIKQNGFIVLFPGSRREEKKWPYFKELTTELLDQGKDCVWAGAAGDASDHVVAELERYSSSFTNLIGKSKLWELAPIIGASSLAVCNDSGPMHLAAAMRKNVLGIFGPTQPELYGPYPSSDSSNMVVCANSANLHMLPVNAVLQRLIDNRFLL